MRVCVVAAGVEQQKPHGTGRVRVSNQKIQLCGLMGTERCVLLHERRTEPRPQQIPRGMASAASDLLVLSNVMSQCI